MIEPEILAIPPVAECNPGGGEPGETNIVMIRNSDGTLRNVVEVPNDLMEDFRAAASEIPDAVPVEGVEERFGYATPAGWLYPPSEWDMEVARRDAISKEGNGRERKRRRKQASASARRASHG